MDIVSLISAVGFPIAMCFYLLLRFETILKENTRATRNLEIVILSIKK